MEDIASQRMAPAALVQRAKIVLLSADGASNQAISNTVNLHYNRVGEWRTYFISELPRLKQVESEFPKKLQAEITRVLSDAPRSGAPRTYSQEQRDFVVSIACNDVTDYGYERSHWCISILTNVVNVQIQECQGMSKSTVWRILQENKLRPHKSTYWLHSKELDENPEEFKRKLRQVHNTYDLASQLRDSKNPTIHIYSVDEMTGIQALERTYQKNCAPGYNQLLEFEYIRHGTTTLIGFLDVVTGRIATPYLNKTRTETDFVDALRQVIDAVDPGKKDTFIIVCDNLNTHMSASLVECIAEECGITEDLGKKGESGHLKSMETRAAFLNNESHRIRIVYTPRHCSWMNQIEWFFGVINRHLLRRKSFKSIEDLEASIRKYIDQHNDLFAHPFQWKVNVEQLIEKLFNTDKQRATA